MTYRIAIVDDNQTDREFLHDQAQSWAEQNSRTLQAELFATAEEFLFHYAEHKDYDILLLDIEMPGMDGVTMARRIRKENETVQIVFITGYSEYISEGYEVAALHYLMKPVKTDKLHQVLDRAADKLQRNERCLTLERSGEVVRLPLYQIRWAEVRQNYLTIHAKADYTVKMTLAELESRLDDRFFRAGRSFIINLAEVRSVTRQEVRLSDGTVIPLPRGQYEPLNRAIISGIGG